MLDFITVNTQSSIRIEDDERVIYSDPFKIADAKNDADIILITHAHYDHFSVEDIKKVMKKDSVIVCPKSLEDAAGLGLRVIRVTAGERFEVCGVEFETVPAYNKLKPFHPKSNGWLGYIVNSKKNGRIYLAGDTDAVDEIKRVNCRIAMLPIGGHFTMDAKSAAEVANAIRPEFVIPIHYGSIVGKAEDAETFRKHVDEGINVVLKL